MGKPVKLKKRNKVRSYVAGLFDVDERLAKLSLLGDPLVELNKMIDWEGFRGDIEKAREKAREHARKSAAGAKPIDAVQMFKIMVLQQLNNLSDDRIEYQIRDRLSFMRFLGLKLEDRVPDAKTVWLFRETLKQQGMGEVLFKRFDEQLAAKGLVAKGGQMIDATFVEVPKSRNSREDNAKLKAGEIPQDWLKEDPATVNMRRQKDTDARWTKKNQEAHFGYKNHVNADAKNKLIRAYAVTAASVHDSQVFDELLDHTTDNDGQKRAAYADSAYRSKEQEERLQANEIESQVCEKGTRGKPLTEEQKASNRQKSKTRARVEHVFGAQAQMGGHVVRVIGMARARVKIAFMNLAYNMRRFVLLCRREIQLWNGSDGRGASAVA
jgi:transposase, IS5 family